MRHALLRPMRHVKKTGKSNLWPQPVFGYTYPLSCFTDQKLKVYRTPISTAYLKMLSEKHVSKMYRRKKKFVIQPKWQLSDLYLNSYRVYQIIFSILSSVNAILGARHPNFHDTVRDITCANIGIKFNFVIEKC